MSFPTEITESDLPQKTWREVHGREPNEGHYSGMGYYESRLRSDAISGSDMDLNVSRANNSNILVPKNGNKILVTLTVLKNDPALKNEESRINAVTEAFEKATKHLRSKEESEKKPVAGARTEMLVVMAESLGMTPVEIMKDGEALSDLLFYLKEVAQNPPDDWDSESNIRYIPPEGDTTMELVKEIEDTWKLPKRPNIGDFMTDRINYRKGANVSPLD